MRINEIVHGKRAITADTAIRLGKFFKMSPQFWLGLQMDYDLDVEQDKLENEGDQNIRPYTDFYTPSHEQNEVNSSATSR